MKLSNAPRVPEDEQHDCPICGVEDYVRYDGDKLCRSCGHVPGPSNDGGVEPDSPWLSWFEHRIQGYLDGDYGGWYGHDRIKFVGGFQTPADY